MSSNFIAAVVATAVVERMEDLHEEIGMNAENANL
jgi:hypothetical protein